MDTSIGEKDEESCKVLQLEEYEVLQSIYPDYAMKEKSSGSIKLEVPVELGEQYTININEDGTLAHQTAEAKSQVISLSTLPPVLLDIILPSSYPVFDPPELVSVRAMHFWLPGIPQLRNLLNEMWQPGEGILYNWIEYLRTGEFLKGMELTAKNNVIQLCHPAPRILASLLESYETLIKSTQFNNSSYLCSICFMSFKGSKCLQLSCNHTFCRSCLADYWKLCIAEGEVGKVGCADPECVKEGREAKVDEVARIVTDEEVRRWKWLREKRTFDRDPTMIHCPMPFCQVPVCKSAVDDEDGSGWFRFRQCTSCGYTFCGMCKRLWHGPHTACSVEHSEKLVLEYLQTEEGSQQRRDIERQYGRATISKLVKNYQEEIVNQQYMKASTTGCPKCDVRVEKSHGCNHMTCRKCGTHFCYRCGSRLNGQDPYSHFSAAGSSCYYKLFDSTAEDWVDVEGFVD
ncbi:hypothetical protein M378DRAFT_183590 [Amanita muscaria Koide BX008]|uniref:RBR-type E3 ubiquitin transferase n=1 Tax=Amanita muscaria (strain Koide BX008) TaxID=946122 RepID=A0A0C2TUU7_AMAMK|nr:hypothetical protein M378DRAFT_183590 [Amanita muscaria Koide BX008]